MYNLFCSYLLRLFLIDALYFRYPFCYCNIANFPVLYRQLSVVILRQIIFQGNYVGGFKKKYNIIKKKKTHIQTADCFVLT